MPEYLIFRKSDIQMKENLIVSDRGQVTLPSAMRKSLGLGKNAVVTAEQTEGRIVLTPAVVVETEIFTEEQIREWDRADVFGKSERVKLTEKLKKGRG
jgi:bifunctional DNA-binding transcriptional regulator/antitoxin component of YhaV-PrlF toxin-antitoxin module